MIKDIYDGDKLKTNVRDDEAAVANREDSYVHFAPAIRFGNSLAGLDRFRNKTWSEIEPEARRLWQEKHERPWEEFKDLVRQAWEEVRVQFSDEVEPVKDSTTYETLFRRHYEATLADSSYDYSQCAPAYHYGYDLAIDKRLRDKTWAEIEPEARRYWHDRSTISWEIFKEAAHYSWNEVRNR